MLNLLIFFHSSSCLESEGKSELMVKAEHGCGRRCEVLGQAGTGLQLGHGQILTFPLKLEEGGRVIWSPGPRAPFFFSLIKHPLT